MDYDKMPGIRRSDLWLMNRSPAHFRYAMDNPREETPALTFGSAMHKYLLEKDRFEEDFAVAPALDRRTKQGKEDYAAFVSGLNGQAVITADEFGQIKLMAEAVWSHPAARPYLDGEHEKIYTWIDSQTDEACKCKVDSITTLNGERYIADYKTTDSCQDGHFESTGRKYGYQFQAGMYTEGVFVNELKDVRFVFIAQEKKPPYAVRVYYCDKGYVNQGYDKFRELIGLYHECRVNDAWPGYEEAELLEEDWHE